MRNPVLIDRVEEVRLAIRTQAERDEEYWNRRCRDRDGRRAYHFVALARVVSRLREAYSSGDRELFQGALDQAMTWVDMRCRECGAPAAHPVLCEHCYALYAVASVKPRREGDSPTAPRAGDVKSDPPPFFDEEDNTIPF